MPLSHLPARARTKAVAADISVDTSPDWIGVWAMSLGASAVMVAAIAYFAGNDPVGAAGILAGAACVIVTVLHASRRRSPR